MKYVPGSDTKKALGQHWLKDESVLQAIAESAGISKGDNVLEVGPGLGTLTDILSAAEANVIALEFDQDLIKNLKKKFADSNVSVVEGDIRKYDLSTLPADYKVAANIPYYLTSNLIRKFADTDNKPSVASLLVQKEVAERICAAPGQMSILSVVAQFYYECTLDIPVPAELFTPPPKVDSQVFVMTRRESPVIDVDPDKFFLLVKAGFSEKRKAMRNALSKGLSISKDESEDLLTSSGLEFNLRAQQLTFSQWESLYNTYYES
ncbi:MAG: 16S rRNA (adenine1518-N6/adenine1519-N6)-dimethyltransferase [Candidatus Saccharimonadales bacterium]|jgi:16S rRNA (adenine1518-N6/adenine1519-N6)-dimethyltransferase